MSEKLTSIPTPESGKKEIDIAKFVRLINFLKELPPEHFTLNDVVFSFDENCSRGTVCCPIGWTPALFPTLCRWTYNPERPVFSVNDDNYVSVAASLFNLLPVDAGHLFSPNRQTNVHPNLKNMPVYSTPLEFALMLEEFTVLVGESRIINYKLPVGVSLK